MGVRHRIPPFKWGRPRPARTQGGGCPKPPAPGPSSVPGLVAPPTTRAWPPEEDQGHLEGTSPRQLQLASLLREGSRALRGQLMTQQDARTLHPLGRTIYPPGHQPTPPLPAQVGGVSVGVRRGVLERRGRVAAGPHQPVPSFWQRSLEWL